MMLMGAANAGNVALLDQYQAAMQNDVLGYYPEYWKLNTNLGFQSPSAIISFAQRYPQAATEKLAADYVEEKVKQADYANAQPVLAYVTNPDRAESCAVAQVRAKTGDPLVFAEYKDIWFTTESQPDSCTGLGRMMLASPLMTAKIASSVYGDNYGQDSRVRRWQRHKLLGYLYHWPS